MQDKKIDESQKNIKNKCLKQQNGNKYLYLKIT